MVILKANLYVSICVFIRLENNLIYFEELINIENQSNHINCDTIYNIFRLNNSYFRFPLPCLKSLENEVRDKHGVFGVR